MKYNFEESVSNIGITLTQKQKQQFEIYYETLVEWNNKMNLTTIIEKDDVYKKHFFDSICLIKAQKITNQTLLDVGSGAGFPSIPLKIIYPELKITIIDALKKRITFLEDLVSKLDIEAELIHGRAEEYKRKHCFDLVTARAVANLNMLCELCIPFVKVGGVFIAMKGPKLEEELKTSTEAIRVLGGKINNKIEYQLDDDKRSIVVIDKLHKTSPKYPRRFNQIKSSPL